MGSKTAKENAAKMKDELLTNKNGDSNDENELKVILSDEEAVSSNEKSSKSSGFKRTMSNPETTTEIKKKIRQKTKPQIIENMKEYLDNNKVEKLTTTTLFHWLKENSIHCTTRDKKADLIRKVKNHFDTKEA